jgi:putative peptidoglycan lipid II flippase
MKISMIAIVVNVVLNLILMWKMKQGGLALATVLASVLNNVLLIVFLQKSDFKLNWKELGRTFAKTAVSSVAAAGLSFVCITVLFKINFMPGSKFIAVIILLVIYGIIYLAANFLLRTAELHEFLLLLKRKGRKN